MNARIEDLLYRAGLTASGCWDQLGAYEREAIEKFAGLIVNECLNQCYNRGMNDELYAGQLRAAEYIEQHFVIKV